MGRDQAEGYDGLWAKQQQQVAHALLRIEQHMESVQMSGLVIKEIRIQGPQMLGEGYRAIIKAETEDRRPYVGFRGGATITELMSSIKAGLEQDGIKWRDDEPWTPQKAAERAAGGEKKKS